MRRNITRQLAIQRTVRDIHMALVTNSQDRLAVALAVMHQNYPQPAERTRILLAAEAGIPGNALLRRVVDREIAAEEPMAGGRHAPIRRIPLEVSRL